MRAVPTRNMQTHIALVVLAFFWEARSCGVSDDVNIDFIFVVDGSGSIGRHGFHSMKRWIANATSHLHSKFGRKAQFGVLQYSRNDDPDSISTSQVFDIPYRLGECLSSRCTTGRVLSMRYLGGSTYTSYALRRVIEVEFPLSNRYPKAKKVIILLTDAKADDGDSLDMMYVAANKQNITIFAITVGNFEILKLKMMTNPGLNPNHVYSKLNWQTSKSITESVIEEMHGPDWLCDECKSGTAICNPHAECIDRDIGYECHCISGYSGNGIDCNPVNHCDFDPCASIPNSYCINGWNGPACLCIDGQILRDNACVDIDFCQSNPCKGPGQVCVDRQDRYECLCAAGYKLDGAACFAGVQKEKSTADFLMITFLVLAFTGGIAIVLIACHAARRRRKYIVH